MPANHGVCARCPGRTPRARTFALGPSRDLGPLAARILGWRLARAPGGESLPDRQTMASGQVVGSLRDRRLTRQLRVSNPEAPTSQTRASTVLLSRENDDSPTTGTERRRCGAPFVPASQVQLRSTSGSRIRQLRLEFGPCRKHFHLRRRRQSCPSSSVTSPTSKKGLSSHAMAARPPS
jgi:hypothetical protein